MIQIETPTQNDAKLISELAVQTFVESHGSSASEIDIKAYTGAHLNVAEFEKQLIDPNAVFRIVYLDKVPIAYSKIIFNSANPKIDERNVCKLEKIYVLKDYFDKKIGKPLLELNIRLAKENNQKGMWLYVWTENRRALRFYEKQGFQIIADTYFKISETHSNPNYWMYLNF